MKFKICQVIRSESSHWAPIFAAERRIYDGVSAADGSGLAAICITGSTVAFLFIWR